MMVNSDSLSSNNQASELPLEATSFEEYNDFNEDLDQQYGSFEITGLPFRASQILYTLDPVGYRSALQEFQQRQIDELKETVYNKFPTPIAYAFYRAENGSENDVQRLYFLKEVWESLIYILYALAVGESRYLHIHFINDKTQINDLFSEKLKDKLNIVVALREKAISDGIGLQCIELIRSDIIERLHMLNRVGEDIFDTGAISEEEARKLFTQLYDEVLSILGQIKDLSRVTLLLFTNHGSSALEYRFEEFSGYAMIRKYKKLTLDKEQYTTYISFLHSENIVLSYKDRIYSVSPFLHFVSRDQGHQTRLCFYKTKNDQDFIYKVIGERNLQTFPEAIFLSEIKELGLLMTDYKQSAANQFIFKPSLGVTQELKIPEMGKHFLSKEEREFIINIIDTIIGSNFTTDGIKNLLRGIIPNAQINRIIYNDGPRNNAERIVGSLEPRGAINLYSHPLGVFLKDLIATDNQIGYEDKISIVALIFRYTLLKDRNQIVNLSAQFQVPSPFLTSEQLINQPFSLSSFPSSIKTTNLQERFESLYNRRRYLLDVKFLSQGAKAASSVCRIDFDKRGEGTGFLVAPDLILTNYHVMLPLGYKGDPNVRARKCEIKFGVIEGLSAGTRFTLDNNKWLIEQSRPEDLDFMLLKLNRPVTANDQVWPLSLESHSIQPDEFVNIIQHPNGGSMEVSIRFNQVVAVEDNRIYYLADSEEGSSGSPVFNDSWELVALHHSGGKLDGSGNLTVAANIGIPINAIREQIAVYLNN